MRPPASPSLLPHLHHAPCELFSNGAGQLCFPSASAAPAYICSRPVQWLALIPRASCLPGISFLLIKPSSHYQPARTFRVCWNRNLDSFILFTARLKDHLALVSAQPDCAKRKDRNSEEKKRSLPPEKSSLRQLFRNLNMAASCDEGYHSDGLSPTDGSFKPWAASPASPDPSPSSVTQSPEQSHIEYFGLQSLEPSLCRNPSCLKRRHPSGDVELLESKQRKLQKENHELRKRLAQAESKAKLAFTSLQREQSSKESMDAMIQQLRGSLSAANERYLDATEDNYALRGELSALRRNHFMFPKAPNTKQTSTLASTQQPQRPQAGPLDRQLEMRQLPEAFFSDSSTEDEYDDNDDDVDGDEEEEEEDKNVFEADSNEVSPCTRDARRSRSAPPRPPRPTTRRLTNCYELEGDYSALTNERRNALSMEPESYLARTLQNLALHINYSSHAKQSAMLARIS